MYNCSLSCMRPWKRRNQFPELGSFAGSSDRCHHWMHLPCASKILCCRSNNVRQPHFFRRSCRRHREGHVFWFPETSAVPDRHFHPEIPEDDPRNDVIATKDCLCDVISYHRGTIHPMFRQFYCTSRGAKCSKIGQRTGRYDAFCVRDAASNDDASRGSKQKNARIDL